MKKIIILLTCILATSFFSMAQDPIGVENTIAGNFKIKAVYSDGNTTNELTITILANGTGEIPYFYPQDNSFELDHFKVYTIDCTPTLTAEFVYGQSDHQDVTDCGRCAPGFQGEAAYTASVDFSWITLLSIIY